MLLGNSLCVSLSHSEQRRVEGVELLFDVEDVIGYLDLALRELSELSVQEGNKASPDVHYVLDFLKGSVDELL